MDAELRLATRMIAAQPELYAPFLADLKSLIQNSSPKVKVVINTCFGGFKLSTAAGYALRALGVEVILPGESYPGGDTCRRVSVEIERHDPRLIHVVESLKEDASDRVVSKFRIVEVPRGVPYRISDHDGQESVQW